MNAYSPTPDPAKSRPDEGMSASSGSKNQTAVRLPRGGGVSSLSHALRAVLRCPMTRAKLVAVDEHHFMSEQPFRDGVHPVFTVTDGIPNFLPLVRAPE